MQKKKQAEKLQRFAEKQAKLRHREELLFSCHSTGVRYKQTKRI